MDGGATMIRELTIKNYKSILDHTIELGRINVFIGENGCGKTNILEAMAMAAAALTDKLTVEELFNRGMRVAKPSIMRSSFPGAKSKEIVLGIGFEAERAGGRESVEVRLSAPDGSVAEVKWSDAHAEKETRAQVKPKGDPGSLVEFVELLKRHRGESIEDMVAILGTDGALALREALGEVLHGHDQRAHLRTLLESFGVYDADILALRGLTTMSRRTPLGLYGETLDVAIAALPAATAKDLLERARCISWLDKFVVDPTDALKYEGHKLGKSQSALYFHDKHMRRRNNVFSAENVNEGILHVLFHLTLFMSEGTPRVLGIDNIETALNPQLCRDLMAQLPALAERYGKQALITTHNPAILDGLNLHDDEQRLFVVSRSDEGHTRTRRIKVKPEVKEAKYKLSELWMRGHLGGLPEKF